MTYVDPKQLKNLYIICENEEDKECIEKLRKQNNMKYDIIVVEDITTLEVDKDYNYSVAFFENMEYNDQVINYFKEKNVELKLIDALWTRAL